MRIEGLSKYQRRKPKGSYFEDLPPHLQERARWWLKRFLGRGRAYRGRIPGWLFPIYVGQAKRLASRPSWSSWGRSMLAKRGGYGVQSRYRSEGRNPTAKATAVRLARQARLKTAKPQRALARKTGDTAPYHPPLGTKPREAVIFCPRPNLTPGPLAPGPPLLARLVHWQNDLPGCKCYYCAWPNHDRSTEPGYTGP